MKKSSEFKKNKKNKKTTKNKWTYMQFVIDEFPNTGCGWNELFGINRIKKL